MLLAGDHLTDDVISQLYAYTKRKMNRLRGSVVCVRMTAQDITHEAIAKTLSNERPWNAEKCPNLFVHLAGCAKSIMSNQMNLKESKNIEMQDDLDHYYEKKSDNQSIVDSDSMEAHRSHRSSAFSPEEMQSAFSDFKFLMEYLSKNRDDLIALAEAMLIHEISKPQELASHLGIDVPAVNAKKLALKRIVLKIQEGEQ